MSVVLNYYLRNAMPALTSVIPEGKGKVTPPLPILPVLVTYLLHTNGRMRCWVGMDTIAQLACNGNNTKAKACKDWLIEHEAMVLVPHDKRVDEEATLPPRQHVYQMTGYLKINGQVHYYLYLNPDTAATIEKCIRECTEGNKKGRKRAKSLPNVLNVQNFNVPNVEIFNVQNRTISTESGYRNTYSADDAKDIEDANSQEKASSLRSEGQGVDAIADEPQILQPALNSEPPSAEVPDSQVAQGDPQPKRNSPPPRSRQAPAPASGDTQPDAPQSAAPTPADTPAAADDPADPPSDQGAQKKKAKTYTLSPEVVQMRDLVIKLWKWDTNEDAKKTAYPVATKYAKMLLGMDGKGEWDEYKLDPPMDTFQLTHFARWYRKDAAANKRSPSLPQKPESLHRWIVNWRSSPAYRRTMESAKQLQELEERRDQQPDQQQKKRVYASYLTPAEIRELETTEQSRAAHREKIRQLQAELRAKREAEKKPARSPIPPRRKKEGE